MNGERTPQLPLDMGGAGQVAAPNTAVDFWDLEGPEGQPMTQDYEFSEIVNVQPVHKDSNSASMVLAVLLLVVLAAVGWFVYTSEEDPVQMVMNFFSGNGETLPTKEAQTTPVMPETQPVVSDDEPEEMADGDERDSRIEGNPYWYLPNEIDDTSAQLNRTWTPEEEELWRSGMAHPDNYQRFKTVKEVLSARLRGSEAILWDALNQPKFWTRMWALVGLADFNIPVSLQVVEETLGQERPELVADYFERFIRKSTAGQRYIMRQSLRLLDVKARVNILKALDRTHDRFRDLYMVAATQDPSPRVQSFVRRALMRKPVPDQEYEKLLNAVTSGELDGVFSDETRSTISDISMQETATGSEGEMETVNEDLSQLSEYDASEDYGEVEIFDEEIFEEETISDDYGDYSDDENF